MSEAIPIKSHQHALQLHGAELSAIAVLFVASLVFYVNSIVCEYKTVHLSNLSTFCFYFTKHSDKCTMIIRSDILTCF